MMNNDYGEDKSFDSQTNADADAGKSYHPGTEYDGDDETVLSVEEVVGEADAPEPSERADTASESESDTFDPFAGMDESERADTDARDPVTNPFVNGLLDDGEEDGEGDEDTEADTGMTNVEVRDTTIGTHHGQPIKVGTERRSRAAVNANAPTDARAGGPDMTNDTPGDILDTDTEHVGVDVSEERMAGRQAEIEATHLRSMDDREERTRDVVTEIDGGVEPVGRQETTETRGVPLGGLPSDVQAEAAKEATRMYDGAEWNCTDARVFQWALGDHLRQQTGEKDVGQAVVANLELIERPPGWTTVEEVNINPDGGRTSIRGEVAQLWDNDNPDIAAVGLLADPDAESTETVKFTVFRSATKAGLTTHYSEPGFPSRHTRAVSAGLKEGQTLHLEDVTQTWDDQGRACIEVSKGGQKDVTTV